MPESKFHKRYQARSFSLNYAAAAALVVGVAATSTASAAVIPEGEYRVCSTTACWITEGATPTAVAGTAGNFYLPANTPMMLQFGGATKIAVIRVAADGSLSLIKTD